MSAKSKPFQAATVRAATAALSGGNPLRRFLVADEVGLGKTLVARDTLATLASKARKFTVYYITSGLKVADQNKVELLRFLDKDEAKDALSSIDRVGLIPFEEKRKGKLRLYAFTPTTSFSSSQRPLRGKGCRARVHQASARRTLPRPVRQPFLKGFMEYGATSGWTWACEDAQGQVQQCLRPLSRPRMGSSVARGIWQTGPREHSARDPDKQTWPELGPDAKSARASRFGFHAA